MNDEIAKELGKEDKMKTPNEKPETYTTLRLLREAKACKERYIILKKALGKNYGDNKPIPFMLLLLMLMLLLMLLMLLML